MENQERAMLEAESEEEEMLEAESTEGALSISRVGRNFLHNRDLFAAESDRIEEEMGKLGIGEMLELGRAERAVPESETENPGIVPLGMVLLPQHTPQIIRNGAVLDGMEMEIEALGTEMEKRRLELNEI